MTRPHSDNLAHGLEQPAECLIGEVVRGNMLGSDEILFVRLQDHGDQRHLDIGIGWGGTQGFKVC